ncbi:MAG: phosphotransferase [Pseudomonadota bacterium]|nr:phosphotransferase [Pseudomonadota bacterium]
MMPRCVDRQAGINAFLNAAGWPPAGRTHLAADCSFRRYERVTGPAGSAVLMDAPPEKEDVRPFITMAERLIAAGYSAPRVLARDTANGFLLLEDLGDNTFTQAFAAGRAEAPLYRLAMDVLSDLHRRPTRPFCADLAPYDDDLLAGELEVFLDWYLPEVMGAPLDDAARAAFLAAWRPLFQVARAVPTHLVLRDYHVDNLMVLEGRAGLATCGLLDFQDAVVGPVTYDIVSLLQDSRRDVDRAVAADLIAGYLARHPDIAPGNFAASYAILGAQRGLKVLGIFARQSRAYGNHGLLGHIPRIWRYIEADLAVPELSPVRALLAEILPPERRLPLAPPA